MLDKRPVVPLHRPMLLVATLALLLTPHAADATAPTGGPAPLPDDPRDALLLAAWAQGHDPDAIRRLAEVPQGSPGFDAAYLRLLTVLELPATEVPTGLPGPVADALVPVVDAMTHAVTLRTEAVAGLTAADWRHLEHLDSAYRASRYQDDRGLLADAWSRGGLPAGLDTTRLAAAAYTLVEAGLEAAPALLAAGASWPLPTTPAGTGLCVDDGVGVLIVCGPFDDTLTGNHILEIDLGGSDLHATNAGASGLGVLWPNSNGLPAALALDLYGHDTYGGGSQVQATGSTTPGVLLDLDGHDTYHAGSDFFTFAQGAGNLGGVGVLYDALGHDEYWTPVEKATYTDSQGFGILGGLGVLHDATGEDDYHGGTMAQGVGDFDAVGLLLDTEGSDRYEAVRNSQGFGDGAGQGILLEATGDEYYVLWEDLGQGAGFGGLGLLWEASGSDVYTAYFGRAQGYGADGPAWKPLNDILALLDVQMAGSGLVVDGEGDDAWHGSAGCDLCVWVQGSGVGLDTF